TDVKPLFEGLGPLNSLSAKIRIAHAFGLLPPDICADVDVIRKIRNEFAHAHQPLSFDSPKISGWVNGMRALQVVRPQLEEFKKDLVRWKEIEEKGWHQPRFLFIVAISSTQGTITAWGNSRTQREPLAPGYAEVRLWP
ncbi:MAG: MltR family transcriptional regulator, partial [Burkholderiales bacterium]